MLKTAVKIRDFEKIAKPVVDDDLVKPAGEVCNSRIRRLFPNAQEKDDRNARIEVFYKASKTYRT